MGEPRQRKRGTAWGGWLAVAVVGLSVAVSREARAQGASPNAGALTLTGSVDAPSVFIFRGIVQEDNPRLTMSPAIDIVAALGRGFTAKVGVWHSLHTGDSGSRGPTDRLHYRADYYASLGVPLAGGLSIDTTYAAYTSPNFLFNTVQELSFKVASKSRYAPHALVAFELSGAADQIDRGTGSYVEVGLRPAFRLGPTLTLAVPVRLGLSASHYYEDFGRNPTFGFWSAGGLMTYPVAGPGRFGAWDVRGGADFYAFGDTTKGYNADANGKVRASRIVARVGIGLVY